MDLGKAKSKIWPVLDDYNGFIIGTSMKMNAWVKHVKSFLDKNKEQLQNKDKKLGMFTCGSLAITEQNKAKEDILDRLMNDYELEADVYNAFKGVLDLSEDSNIGKIGKTMLRLGAKEQFKETDIQIDINGRNDFRDWDEIRSFASEFAEIL